MGIAYDENKKFTPEIREYLQTHGMAYKVIENDRIFGEVPEPEVDDKLGLTKGVDPEPMQGADGRQGWDVNEPRDTDDGDDGEIDDDIVEYVEGLKVDELKSDLDDRKVDYPSDAKKADLQGLLANAMQDERDQ